jgi:hypothetical protein
MESITRRVTNANKLVERTPHENIALENLIRATAGDPNLTALFNNLTQENTSTDAKVDGLRGHVIARLIVPIGYSAAIMG